MAPTPELSREETGQVENRMQVAGPWGRTGLEAVLAVGRSLGHRLELLSRKKTKAWELTECQRQRGSRERVLGYESHSSPLFNETGEFWEVHIQLMGKQGRDLLASLRF